MKKQKNSLSSKTILLLIGGVLLVGYVGWYLWQSQEDSYTTATGTTITFDNEAGFDSAAKQEILSKVVNPLVNYYDDELKMGLKNVVVSAAPNQMSPADYRYKLTYGDSTAPTEQGFLFGANNQIGYWLPALCDPGGCQPYPEDFKQKYPETYQAYMDCEAANNANDKEKANLVCAP